MDLATVLAELQGFLEREGFPVAVVGALALHTYGHTRATNDLDVVTRAEVRERVVAFLEQRGYETLHVSDGYSNHVHPDPVGGRIDLIYVDERTANSLFAEVRRASVAGVDVLVPSPEHLAAMKVQAMKNDPARTFQDMADIRYLVDLPGVSRDSIRGYFEKAGLRRRWDELESSF
jgi:hypothetical protein